MKIIDLDEKNEALYCLCLEEWSDEIREAADHKKKCCSGRRRRDCG